MKKVTLTRVYKGMKDTKYGSKPTVAFKCEEYGDKWISTFKVTPEMDSWKEGDTVSVNITEKNGFTNFDTQPNPNAELEERVAKLEEKVFGTVHQKQTAHEVKKEVDLPEVPLDDFDF